MESSSLRRYRMTSHPTDDVASLAARLESTNADERVTAAEKLCQTGESAATAAIPLVRACGDADERVREWAVAALEDLGPPPADVIATLATLATGSVPLVAYWAVTLLGRAGQAAASTAGVLADCLASGDAAVAQRAAWALGKLGPAAAVANERLHAAAQSADPRLASLASEALATIGGA
jgi:HEAT repeat protein